jgi:hypothetical protein
MKNSLNIKSATAAELALKAHSLYSTSDIGADIPDTRNMMRQINSVINLREAPEDAVCSLVMDLMHYCNREEIDWDRDVMLRARENCRLPCVNDTEKK